MLSHPEKSIRPAQPPLKNYTVLLLHIGGRKTHCVKLTAPDDDTALDVALIQTSDQTGLDETLFLSTVILHLKT